ncbi:nucleotide sugar dehydrogenase [Neolewinella lacunae]|uniref:Nucleotide sugar dehydrogenase n=1 Tax=Neolewinella lacunae TaxID=1517758 RepID=A0A923PMY0_9BACT|nr:nucleotide sugar dehydrogenase [Neolewinella lacunae]MBC6994173.1 nucleotide sugar dehydrogenase [Neolewinella lacunae]MDN3636678.1 nucleotide sugar dehydrogenase [Neolewinella lacunae]
MKNLNGSVASIDAEQQLAEYRNKTRAISVIGLGYVGLPLALELAKKFRVIGFDISESRVEMMQRGEDPSEELEPAAFAHKDILFTCDRAKIREASLHIVAVPTPVDDSRTPNLRPLLAASATVGKALKVGDIAVFESTVYPGCTEEDCVPVLEKESGLRFGADFTVGYSPERINPGDKEHTVDKILKIVSGSDAATLRVIAGIYGDIITAGIYEAATIRVAEAAKVIENSQRDLNISFVNELSVIFKRMGIDTQDVLDAAGTKWNFLPFRPGLVGGHCISVDPYYLLHKSVKLGYDPQVIASGRRVNDSMPAFIAKELVQHLLKINKNPKQSKVLMLGVTFKENVSDIRNSKVVDVVRELMEYGVNVHLYDPHASPNEVAHEYGLTMIDEIGKQYDAIVVAVAHREFRAKSLDDFRAVSKDALLLFDLKSIFNRAELREGEEVWRL